MDITHLKQIGEVDTHTIFVDSGDRDKEVFRTPGHYEIVFDRAFENVVGLDVLDASIPSTLYIVDSHNNSVAMSYRVGGNAETVGKSIPEYLEILKGSPSFQEMVDDPATPLHKVKIVGQHARPSGVVEAPEGVHHVVYYNQVGLEAISPEPVALLGGEPIVLNDARSGGFARFEVLAGGDVYEFRYKGESARRELATFLRGGARYAVLSITEPSTGQIQLCYALLENLKNVPADDVVNVVFAGGVAESLEGCAHKRVSKGYYDELGVFVHEYHSEIFRIEVGDHDVDALVAVLLQAMPKYSRTGNPDDATQFAIIESFSRLFPSDFTRDKRLLYRATDLFWFDMKKSTAADVLGFSEIAQKSEGYQLIPSVNNKFVFGAVQNGGIYELYSPGMINLFGERFVVLRCPQIEENGNASLSYEKYSTGIGIFKLYNSTVAHLRFDFTNLRKLDMHPIGKLSKLTLRFEKATGELYDFKGVDHHLLLAIKFLKPVAKNALVEPERRLNPDYRPEALEFITNYYEDDLDESTTEDDDDLLEDVRHRARFMKLRASGGA